MRWEKLNSQLSWKDKRTAIRMLNAEKHKMIFLIFSVKRRAWNDPAHRGSLKNGGRAKERYRPALQPAKVTRGPASIILPFAFFLLALNLCISSAWAASVTLAWDPSPQLSVRGYKIHYGTESGNYSRTLRVKGRLVSKVVIKNLDEGKTYFFVITSLTASGKESAYSPEINNGQAQTIKQPAQNNPAKIPPSKNVARTPDGKIIRQKQVRSKDDFSPISGSPR
jgi:hypothetical protein